MITRAAKDLLGRQGTALSGLSQAVVPDFKFAFFELVFWEPIFWDPLDRLKPIFWKHVRGGGAVYCEAVYLKPVLKGLYSVNLYSGTQYSGNLYFGYM